LPIEYTADETKKRLSGMTGEKVSLNIPESEFRHTVEGIPVNKLSEVPGMGHWVREIATLLAALKGASTGSARTMAKKQCQPLYFNPRLENTILEYVARFYKGDINETVKDAFETLIAGMYSAKPDKDKVKLLVDQVQWVPTEEERRRGLNRPEMAGKRAEAALKSVLDNPKVPAEIKAILRMPAPPKKKI
jgi:hypothetical protein